MENLLNMKSIHDRNDFRIFVAVAIVGMLFFSGFNLVAASTVISSYRSESAIISDYFDLEREYPDLISHETIGRTVQGKAIYLFKIGNSEGEIIFVDAGMHGNEMVPPEVLYHSVVWLVSSTSWDARNLRSQNCILVIPVLNRDMYGESRFNANDVDVNRNFETGWGEFGETKKGDSPLSEPETRALQSVFLRYDVKWYLNLHTGLARISPPLSSERYVPDSDYYRRVISAYNYICRVRDVDPIPYTPSYILRGGTARDEGYIQGAYTFVVELASSRPSYSDLLRIHVPQFENLLIAISRY